MPDDEFIIIEFLPHPDSLFDQYQLVVVEHGETEGNQWYAQVIQLCSEKRLDGTFSFIKRTFERILTEAFKNRFKGKVTYLEAYFA